MNIRMNIQTDRDKHKARKERRNVKERKKSIPLIWEDDIIQKNAFEINK